MHIRMNTITGATDVDAGTRLLREKAIPELQSQRGFKGLLASQDRANRSVSILSLWNTEEDMRASESTVAKVRSETLRAMGGEVNIELFEQLLEASADPPPAEGCPIRVRRLRMEQSGSVDETVRYFESELLPRLKATPGFRGVRVMVNRATGTGVIGSVWSDDASMHAADALAEEGLREAAARGVQVTGTTTRVLLVHHLT
jgi:heme-degrading monooxygenase HmoA